jgi:uncharacterized protein (DUF1330 family)
MIEGKTKTRTLAVLLLTGATAGALYAAAPAEPKGYVIGEITVTDPATYKDYATATTPLITRFGGRYLVRGGKVSAVEGLAATGRVVVIEFPSVAQAEAYEHSPEYLAIAPIRQRSSTGRLFIVEGVAP